MMEDAAPRLTSAPDAAEPSALQHALSALAEARDALERDAGRLRDLDRTLEAALAAARGAPLERVARLARLADAVLDAARAQAEAIVAMARQEASARRAAAEAALEAELAERRAAAEAELARRREAVEAELSAKRATFEQYVESTRVDLDRLSSVLAGATRALADIRGPLADAEPPPSGPPDGQPWEPGQPTPSVVETPAGKTAAAPPPAKDDTPTCAAPASPAASPPGVDVSVPLVADTPDRPAGDRPAGALVEPRAATPAPALENVLRLLDEPTRQIPPPGGPMSASAAAAPVSPAYAEAAHDIAAGNVAAGLEGFRSIIERSPEQVEPMVERLTELLRDSQYHRHHDEIRLLLVDAFMVQGDYDRAMSLLHEPSS